MIITYHNGGFIKIVSGDLTIAFNPISKDSRLKPTNFGADVVFVSADNSDCNGVDTVKRNNKNLFVIDGAGEYEVSGVFAKGVATKTQYNNEGKDIINTMYSLHIEDVHILNLGLINEDKLTGKMLDGIDDVDIVILPISGEGTIDPGVANKMANSLEAKVVMPTFYNKDTLNTFLKESSAESVKPIEKLVIKKKDLINKTGEVVVLAA